MVIGGGVGGHALALSLHAAGIGTVELYEQAPELRALGMGINLLPHAMRELTELGVAEALSAVGISSKRTSYYTRSGEQIWSEPRGTAAGYRWPQLSLHRKDLLRIIHAAAVERQACQVHTGHRLVSVGQDGRRAWADFVDEQTGRPLPRKYADVLIGADGAGSVTRRCLHPNEGPRRWSGILIFKGLVDHTRHLDGCTTTLTGSLTGPDAKAFAAYSVSREHQEAGRSLVSWGAYDRVAEPQPLPDAKWTFPDNRAEALERFGSWRFADVDAAGLISATHGVLAVPMTDRDPLPRWSFGRITLLGDAAHPMYPTGSNGASQAIADARVLARALSTQSDVPSALAAYDAERRPATSAVVLANRAGDTDAVCLELAHRHDLADLSGMSGLVGLSDTYKSLAGYQLRTLNERPSLATA
ncbi:FAD-dependent monooxygenase [Streptomyces sp. NPDC058548]|uniref:FAD-dependent monooxygenase n=1 Tax=unclassified Streptomyces TaxID=2593676 RepID=UPI00365BCDA0